MPRIDEALARARNANPEELRPLAGVGVEGDVPSFPSEEYESIEAPAEAAEGAVRDDDANESRAIETGRGGPVVLGPVKGLSHLKAAEKLAISADPRSIEQYRRVATRLHLMKSEQRTSVVMVTSALPAEGKTLTAANLALTLSESYRRQVLLIDADLRRPWMHEIFQVPNVTGLNDGLRAEVERKVPLIRITDHLSLLTAGRPDPDPTSVLSSDRMQRVIEEAQTKFEWVIIDTPPVGLLTDAHLLTSLVDTVLLVVHAGKTQLPAVRAAVQSIGRDRILGIVLNRSEEALGGRSYSYYNYYGYYADHAKSGKTEER